MKVRSGKAASASVKAPITAPTGETRPPTNSPPPKMTPARTRVLEIAGDGLVPPEARLELLYTRSAPIRGGLSEGVAAAPDGSMYFSEIPFGNDKGMIMRFDPSTKTTTVC